MAREILIVGVNYHRAPVEIRERLGKPRAGRITLSACQKGNHVEIVVEDDGAGIDEGAIVSTFNRVEVIAATSDGDHAVESLTDFLALKEAVTRAQLAHFRQGQGISGKRAGA